ncbi:hypothetical protein GSI_14494 [Ganoderma sinense ZZ0214-1]|uniref:Uncharacterized protein n=1 Tax=Ganoderma sinense ZZ0214-1 TaxID=1077348 RepID=A0A2G8RNU5_9APHY|nr:hypothetical protein GSI_14494 [Ganoderma sinense ZZ0214-1]
MESRLNSTLTPSASKRLPEVVEMRSRILVARLTHLATFQSMSPSSPKMSMESMSPYEIASVSSDS